jgi:hypothetical protein
VSRGYSGNRTKSLTTKLLASVEQASILPPDLKEIAAVALILLRLSFVGGQLKQARRIDEQVPLYRFEITIQARIHLLSQVMKKEG